MRRAVTLLAVVSTSLALGQGTAAATGGGDDHEPGAPGIGDPYYPLDGNGGYDVEDYALDLGYEPATDVLTGVATITSTATQDLSAFNLDFVGLTVRSVTVDGDDAAWARDGGELTITPGRGLDEGSEFRTVVAYDGVPALVEDEVLGTAGFFHTDDGALVVGQPDVAATWFPANDHPVDAASFSVAIDVPEGLEAVSNGVLEDESTEDGRTTWRWRAAEPMAPYLATMAIGEFEVEAYEEDGVEYLDAIDSSLFEPFAQPRTGESFAVSGDATGSYERLTRTVAVPAGGAELSFWTTRRSEEGFDVLTVEARAVGTEDWTTLPDAGGAATQDVGGACPGWLELHPFLTHYQTALAVPEEPADGGVEDGEEPPLCEPTGTTGEWWAASGSSDGYEQWVLDLGGYAGGAVEVSISYVSDEVVQVGGVVVDDVEVSTGEGSTSFEDDGDVLDGWVVAGPPEGTEPNDDDWEVGTAEDLPPALGEVARGSLDRQPEVLALLGEVFGPYPFSAAGGIVDVAEGLGFALETQTRPVYAPDFFGDPVAGDSVVVHELAHQWVGDDLRLERWQHIWLNEGFATYAEWLWSEHEGLGTAQEIFEDTAAIPADDAFWALAIGDPGPDRIFDGAVYGRGAMTLHALRLEIGDEDFFALLREWTSSQAGGTVTTEEFTALAEEVSGQELDDLFEEWLFTAEKPADLPEPPEAPEQEG